MRGFHHREVGVVGAGFLARDIPVELIADGYHVCFPAIELLLKLKGSENICLITDTVAIAGLDDGEYTIAGGIKVKIEGHKAVEMGGRTASTPLSILTMDTAVKNIVNLGIDLPTAIRMATYTPAKALGFEERLGSLENGKIANIILLDQDLNIKRVFVEGTMVFHSESP